MGAEAPSPSCAVSLQSAVAAQQRMGAEAPSLSCAVRLRVRWLLTAVYKCRQIDEADWHHSVASWQATQQRTEHRSCLLAALSALDCRGCSPAFTSEGSEGTDRGMDLHGLATSETSRGTACPAAVLPARFATAQRTFAAACSGCRQGRKERKGYALGHGLKKLPFRHKARMG